MCICHQCGYSTPSTRGWWRHRRQEHAVLQPAKLYLDSTIYQLCNTDHHTLARLWWHVAHSRPSCLHYGLTNEDSLPIDRVKAAQELHAQQEQVRRDKGFSTRYAWPPPQRRPGPQCQTVSKTEAEDFLSYDIPPTVEPQLLPEFPQHLTDSQPSIPNPFKWYYIFHLFSSQRREHDFQLYVDKLIEQSCVPVVVLSIDIVKMLFMVILLTLVRLLSGCIPL